MEEKNKETPNDGASSPDASSSTPLSVREQFVLYQFGWRAGAGCHAIPERFKDPVRCAEYHRGYSEGRKAYTEACAAARKRLGAPPPNILRTAEEHRVDAAHLRLMVFVDGKIHERSFVFDELSLTETSQLDGVRVELRGTRHRYAAVLEDCLGARPR